MERAYPWQSKETPAEITGNFSWNLPLLQNSMDSANLQGIASFFALHWPFILSTLGFLNKPFISSWLVGIAFSEHLGFERYNIVHAVALVSELWKAHFRIKKMSNVDFFLFFKRYENARNNAGLQLLYLISKIKMERSKYIFMHSLYRNEILRVSEFLKDCWKCTEN